MDEKAEALKLLLVGDSGIGKSTLCESYVKETFTPSSMATMGSDYGAKKIKVDNKLYKLQIWDTSGARRFKPIATAYYPGVYGIVLSFDLTNRESFENLKNYFLYNILRYARFERCGMVVVGLKSDLEKHREVTREELELFAHSVSLPYVECSAKSQSTLSLVFDMLTREILRKKQLPNDNAEFPLRFYASALEYIEEAEGKDSIKIIMLHIKNSSNGDEGVARRAADELKTLAQHFPRKLEEAFDFFLNNLNSSDFSEREEAIEGVSGLGRLNSPKMIVMCRQILESVTVEARNSAIKIFEKINILTCAEIIDMYFHGDFKKRDVVNVLRKIGAYKDLSKLADKVLGELFFAAAFKGNLPAVKALIEIHGVSPQRVNTEGNTALKIAVEGEHTGVAKYLLESGVSCARQEPPQLALRAMRLYK